MADESKAAPVSTGLLALLKDCGGDVASLKEHAVKLLADDTDGNLDAEHEQMAQVVGGSMAGAVGVALGKFLADELLNDAEVVAKATALRKERQKAVDKSLKDSPRL